MYIHVPFKWLSDENIERLHIVISQMCINYIIIQYIYMYSTAHMKGNRYTWFSRGRHAE